MVEPRGAEATVKDSTATLGTTPLGAEQVPAAPLDRLGAVSMALATSMPGVSYAAVENGELVVHAEPAAVPELMLGLRDDPRFACQQLMDLCAVDWPTRKARFEVVYNLLSVSLNHRVRVVVPVAEGEAVPSVHTVWPVATWFEREAWDLFGVPFSGQPDLRRILTDYGFDGHPLRKDFPLTGYTEVRWDDERKQVVYEPVNLTQDFRTFEFLSPWEGMTTLPGDEKAHTARQDLPVPPVPSPYAPTPRPAPGPVPQPPAKKEG